MSISKRIQSVVDRRDSADTHTLFWTAVEAATQGHEENSRLLVEAYNRRGLVDHYHNTETLRDGRTKIDYYWAVDVTRLGWAHDDGKPFIKRPQTIYFDIAWVKDWESGDNSAVLRREDDRVWYIPSITRPGDDGLCLVHQTCIVDKPVVYDDSPSAIEAQYLANGLGHILEQ